MPRNDGELPDQFTAELEGVDATLPVVGTRVLAVGRGPANEPRAAALASFLEHFSSGSGPAGFEPRAALYELRNRDDQPFWIGRNSTMGQRNNRRLVEAFAHQAPPRGQPIYPELSGFEERNSLLVELLGDAHAPELGPAATALAELIVVLTDEHPEQAVVEREIYVRTALIDEFSGEWTRVFIVDASPLSGPERFAWMLVWTDAWVE